MLRLYKPIVEIHIDENALGGNYIAAFSCQCGSLTRKALGKLRASLGIEKPEAEPVPVVSKGRPHAENEWKPHKFCKGFQVARVSDRRSADQIPAM